MESTPTNSPPSSFNPISSHKRKREKTKEDNSQEKVTRLTPTVFGSFEVLPPEATTHILSFLDRPNLFNMRVNSEYKNLVEHETEEELNNTQLFDNMVEEFNLMKQE